MVSQSPEKHNDAQTALLAEMAKVIVETIQPEKVILFGSQAKGTDTADSDYDFLIIDSEPLGQHRSRRKLAAKISWELSLFGVPTDVLIYSVDEVNHWSQSPNHVISRALREGRVLYERSRTS